MHGKNNLISDDQDRSICSLSTLIGIPGNRSSTSIDKCEMTRLFKDNNLHTDNKKLESANLFAQNKPGFLRLDSTGDEQIGMMAPQNQKNVSGSGGVQYITQTMQQQHPNPRCDRRRSPTPTNCGNHRYTKGHNSSPNGRHRQPRSGGPFPGSSLLSNVSGYQYRNCSPHATPQQWYPDHSQNGYPFHRFGYHLPNGANNMMPLGTSRFRAPMFGYPANFPYCYSYHPPKQFMPTQGPGHPSIFHQARQFMPGCDTRHGQNSYQNHYRSQDRYARQRPRERSRKRRAKKHCRDSDVVRLAESLEKVSVEQGDKSPAMKRTSHNSNILSLVPDEGDTCLSDKDCDIDDDVRQQDMGVDHVPGSWEEDVESGSDVNSLNCTAECADISDEISMQCPANVSLVNPGQLAKLATCSDPVTHNVKCVLVDCENTVTCEGDNTDSGFYEQPLPSDTTENTCSSDKNGEVKCADSLSEHSDVTGFEIVPEILCNALKDDSSPTAGSGAKSDYVIIEKDNTDGFICAYNMEILETDGISEESLSKDGENLSDVTHFSVHVTELEHFNKDKTTSHCHKDDDIRTVDTDIDKEDDLSCRSASPPQGQNSAACALSAKQKKKSRPSAKKRKRMKQKKGIINFSICDLSEKSPSNSDCESDVHEKDNSEKSVGNSPAKGRFRTVSFIVGSDSDSDDFDIEFVSSPRHSPPKSCPKLQFNLLSSDSDDEDASGSDSDFESDENITDWNQDVLLDSFCIKDPYSPFSFQLQCTSVPMKKSVSSPQLSPPNAFAFDVTIKRSLDPNRRRVSFNVDKLTEVIEEEEMLAHAFQEARKGPWEEMARDRHRFERRIADVDSNIGYVFHPDHRKRVYDRLYADCS